MGDEQPDPVETEVAPDASVTLRAGDETAEIDPDWTVDDDDLPERFVAASGERWAEVRDTETEFNLVLAAGTDDETPGRATKLVADPSLSDKELLRDSVSVTYAPRSVRESITDESDYGLVPRLRKAEKAGRGTGKPTHTLFHGRVSDTFYPDGRVETRSERDPGVRVDQIAETIHGESTYDNTPTKVRRRLGDLRTEALDGEPLEVVLPGGRKDAAKLGGVDLRSTPDIVQGRTADAEKASLDLLHETTHERTTKTAEELTSNRAAQARRRREARSRPRSTPEWRDEDGELVEELADRGGAPDPDDIEAGDPEVAAADGTDGESTAPRTETETTDGVDDEDLDPDDGRENADGGQSL